MQYPQRCPSGGYITLILLIIFSGGCTSSRVTPHLPLPISTPPIAPASEASIRYEEWFESIRNQVPQQITTNTDIDLFPAISPDGQTLVFVSGRTDADQNANWNLWKRAVNGSRPSQLTRHTSADVEPAWHPKKEQLVYVSRRKDAGGDLWTIPIHDLDQTDEHATQLTHFNGEDTDPDWHPSGDQIVFTSRRHITSTSPPQRNLWLCTAKGENARPLTQDGGFAPRWSPDGKWIAHVSFRGKPDNNGDLWLISANGDSLVQLTSGSDYDLTPAWSPDGQQIVFARYHQDTNGDGHVTLADNPGLYRIDLSTRRVIPLTTHEYINYQPVWSPDGRSIYFATNRSGNMDIWQMPAFGEVPIAPSAEFQLRYAHWIRNNRSATTAMLAYHRVIDNFPASPYAAEAFYQLGQLYEKTDQQRLALDTYQTALQNYPETPLKPLIQIAYIQAQWKHQHNAVAAQKAYQRLLEEHQQNEWALARIYLAMGDLHHVVGENSRALEQYQHVVDQFPRQYDSAAEANLKIADIYTQLGDRGSGIERYLHILETYFTSEKWTAVAEKRIIAFYTAYDNPMDQLTGFYQIIQSYPFYTSLCARAQFQIGTIYEQQQQYDAALSAYEQLIQQYPNEHDWQIQALFAMGRIYSHTGDDRTEALYKLIIQEYGRYENGTVGQRAREHLVQTYLNQGQNALDQHQPAAAAAFFQQALQQDSLHWAAHRGWIRSQHHQLPAIIAHYDSLRTEFSHEATYHYAAGFARIEQFHQTSNMQQLAAARPALETALDLDFRQIDTYLALGYVYEGLRKDYEQQRRENRIEPDEREFLYELAIEKYQIALTLNDEQQFPQWEAALLLNLANTFYHLADNGDETSFQKAYYYYQQKIEMDSTFQSVSQEIEIQRRMGRCAFFLEDVSAGNRAFHRLIELARLQRDSALVYEAYQQLGALYYVAKDYPASSRYIQRALHQLDDVELPAEERQHLQRLCFRQIATNALHMGNYDSAIYWAKRAEHEWQHQDFRRERTQLAPLQIVPYNLRLLTFAMPFVRIPTTIGESRGQKPFSPSDEITLVYSILAESYYQLQDYERARDFTQKRLEILEMSGNAQERAICYNNLGNIYLQLKNEDEALFHFENSLQICRDPKHDFQVGALINYQNLGQVYLAMLDRSASTSPNRKPVPVWRGRKALHYQTQALELIQRRKAERPVFTVEDQRMELAIYHQLASIYFALYRNQLDPRLPGEKATDDIERQNQIKSSQEVIRRYLTDLKQQTGYDLGLDSDLTTYLNQQATSTIFDTFYQQALAYYLQADRLSFRYDHPRERALIRKNVALVYLAQGDTATALSYLSVGPNSARSLAATHGLPELLWQVLYIQAQVTQAADERLKLLYQALDIVEALPPTIPTNPADQEGVYAETIATLMAQNRVRAALIVKERQRAHQLIDISGNQRLNLPDSTENRALQLGRQIVNIRYHMQTLLPEQKQERQQYHLQRERAEAELSALTLADTAVYDLFRVNPPAIDNIQQQLTATQALIAYHVGYNQSVVWVISKNRIVSARLPLSTTQLASLTHTLHDQLSHNLDSLNIFLEWVYDAILQPVTSELATYSEWTILPDKMLYAIPFAALRHNGRYVIEDHRVTYASSLSSVLVAQQQQYLPAMNTLLVATEERRTAFTLAGSLTEVGELVFSLPQPYLLEGDSLSPATLRRMLPDYGLVHLALRASPRPQLPLRTPLYLAYNQTMSLFEWFEIPLQANLVTISGWNMPDADPDAEEPVMVALERALLFAGVSSVLVSQWEIEPAARIALLGHLYEYQQAQNTIAGALQQTQIEAIQRQQTVREWAGFRLWGFPGLPAQSLQKVARQQLEQSYQQALHYRNAGQWERAIHALETALRLAEYAAPQRISPIYNELVQALYENGDYRQAATTQQKQLTRLQKDRTTPIENITQAHRMLVRCLRAAQQPKLALRYQERYVAFLHEKQLSDHFPLAYTTLAELEIELEAYDPAKQHLDDAQQYSQQHNRPDVLAKVLRLRGDLAFRQINVAAALASYRQALPIYQQLADTVEIAHVFWQIGRLYLTLARPDSALEAFQQADQYLRVLGTAPLQMTLAQEIATAALEYGDYTLALKWVERAELRAGNPAPPSTPWEITRLKSHILWLQGKSKQSFRVLQTALQHAQLNPVQGHGIIMLKSQLGLMYLQEHHPTRAQFYFSEVLATNDGFKSLPDGAKCHYNLAVACLQAAQVARAKTHLDTALAWLAGTPDPVLQSAVELRLGEIAYQEQQIEQADSLLQNAWQHAHQAILPELEGRILAVIAANMAHTGHVDSAVVYYRRALDYIERSDSRAFALEYGFFIPEREIYESLVRLLLAQNKPEAAWEVAARAKWWDYLKWISPFPGQRSELKAYRSLKSAYQSHIQQARLYQKQGIALPEQLQHQLGEQSRKIAREIQHLVTDQPRASLMVSTAAIDLQRVQAHLPKDTVVLDYFWMASEVWVWVISAQAVRAVPLHIHPEQLAGQVAEYQRQLYYVMDTAQTALALYTALIAPVEDHVQQYARWCIVPDRVLASLSFGALKPAPDSYLMDTHRLRYAPSAMFAIPLPPASASVANRMVVLSSITEPLMAKEAISAKRLVPGVILQTEMNIQRGRVDSMLVTANQALFSCPLETTPANPLYHHITWGDHQLAVYSILDLEHRLKHITISGGLLDLPDTVSAIVPLGIPTAFLLSGAPTVVGALWRSDNLSTAIAIKRYLRALPGNTTEDALNAAQSMIRERFPHPSYWANLILFGSGD
ncbi:MAG: CHAT domain-containing protein [Gemmatimonadetes bacterium]|nr:MAG: CHAT domain-containing protein [Gemmatimonadota bacterium]